MIKYIIFILLFGVLSAAYCKSDSGIARYVDEGLIVATSLSTPSAQGRCDPGPSFNERLLKHGFSVGPAELIKKTEIQNITDNIKAVKKIFKEKENIFDKFSNLGRYNIKKNKSQISARFYCFEFPGKEDAQAWFNVIDNPVSKDKRLVTFSKPKKLMALSGDHIYIVEGYNISKYDVLYLIVDQLTGVEAILGPEITNYK